MERSLSGFRQEADQVANRKRAKLCWAQNTVQQDAQPRREAKSWLVGRIQDRAFRAGAAAD